jgi:EAL domain-containing protein (putative c-di-GMP-specific phosphodiesterase class I)
VAELRSALRNEEIKLYLQPQLDARDGSLHGVEALARWISPVHGVVPPTCFIELAEQNGLIDELTESILGKSLAACGGWNRAGLRTRISVNTPISSMCSLVLPDTIAALCQRRGLEPQQLTLEITESGLMQDPVRALDVLTRLRLRGVDLAIDDFGCGYSSLQQLKRMPFNELKIDCSFVMSMLRDAESRGIVKSSLNLCRELGLRSVAEGVESAAHWDALLELDCDMVQGYHIARPFPAEQMLEWNSRRAPVLRR